MIWFKRFLMSVGVLALLALSLVVVFMDFSKPVVPVLPEHPAAHWQGAADGGHFIEITRSEPPYYFVQVRYESGDLWSEGWLKYEGDNGVALSANEVIAFDGDGVIYLQQRKVLAADQQLAR